MSLIRRSALEERLPSTWKKTALAVVFSAWLFLFFLSFGGAPVGTGLDPSWTEVLAWGFLHHLQWGRDIVFTYGPLGFLHPFASYVDGEFTWYMLGQVVLTSAFALIAGLTLYKQRGAHFWLMILSFVFVSHLAGDGTWFLTLIFGASILTDWSDESDSLFFSGLLGYALIAGAVALTKFSAFPIWFLGMAALVAICCLQRRFNRAVAAAISIPGGLLLAWVASGQELFALAGYVRESIETAAGYGHAMGAGAPVYIELAAASILVLFWLACAYASWTSERKLAASIICAFSAAIGFLAWRTFLTRGDHAPWFFSFMAVLPFALGGSRQLSGRRGWRFLVGLVVVASGLTCFHLLQSPAERVNQVVTVARRNLSMLVGLKEVAAQRDAQWKALRDTAALPKIHSHVGESRVDVLSYEQAVAFVNGFNYSPRPVFQGYAAYTPRLARLNESFFLDENAPPFVILKIQATDNHLPASEDALALLALLQRYRPVLLEQGFLLLERQTGLPASSALSVPLQSSVATLGTDIEVAQSAGGITVAFVDLKLSLLGSLYSFALREPSLNIKLTDGDGVQSTYRFLRPTGGAGFAISPALRSGNDWVNLYLKHGLRTIKKIRIEPEQAWQRIFFDPQLSFAFRQLGVLTNAGDVPQELVAALFPGFNVMPAAVVGATDTVVEEGKDSVFLHAPAAIEFHLPPGHFRGAATYGIRMAALQDAACRKAGADGVGISLVIRHASGSEINLWHQEINPFESPQERGPQRMEFDNIDTAEGDVVIYRVDPGHGGNNLSCDWSYVRDLNFTASGAAGRAPVVTGSSFAGFNLAPTASEGLINTIVEDGENALFMHAPAAMEFQPVAGRYDLSVTYGIRNAAWKDAGCIKANPDGVGISVILRMGAEEKTLMHVEVDPFRIPGDRGPHHMAIANVQVGEGAVVSYKVDPGKGGDDRACDWSYVRNFNFKRR